MDKIAVAAGIKRRSTWGAVPPARTLESDWNYNSIVIHNTGHGHIDTMAKIQKFDLSVRDWDDMAYHYGIMPDGTIFEGRQIIYKGSDVYLQNTGKIGVVCLGDYDSSSINWLNGRPYSGDPVLPAMLASMRKLTKVLCDAFPILFFGGHIEYGKTTDCPGSTMVPYMSQFRKEYNLQKPTKKIF